MFAPYIIQKQVPPYMKKCIIYRVRALTLRTIAALEHALVGVRAEARLAAATSMPAWRQLWKRGGGTRRRLI